MNTTFTLAFLCGAVALAGCSSTTATTTTGADSGSGTNSQECQTYCTSIMANCTSTTSADGGVEGNQQYTTIDNCLNSCKAMPVGTTADTSGNTLGCRTYHAGAAKADPVTHCVHAGPGGAGTCGDNCDGYCQIAMMYCTTANEAKVYDTLAQCKTTCAGFPDNVKFSLAVDTGKSTACLLYHSQEASSVPPDHCLGDLIADDAGNPSTTCQ